MSSLPSLPPSAQSKVSANPVLVWLSAVFSDRAWLTLFTLLVLMGLVGGLFKLTNGMALNKRANAPSTAAGPVETRSFGSASQNASCGQVLVFFSGSATLQQVSSLLRSVDAVLSYGPNENGAFELRTSAALAADVARALELSPLVTLATAQPRCG